MNDETNTVDKPHTILPVAVAGRQFDGPDFDDGHGSVI
jgi:hypothetical protein